jgi:hypothetical protein
MLFGLFCGLLLLRGHGRLFLRFFIALPDFAHGASLDWCQQWLALCEYTRFGTDRRVIKKLNSGVD